MNKISILALFSIITAVSCNSPVTKKVLIMGRGQISVSGNEIKMKDGTGYVEETVEVKEEKPLTWNVTTPTGKIAVNIPEEKGLYVLNLKTDTIVGSEQNMAQDLAGRTMTQEELKVKIDSLVKLTTGSNVSPSGHNYFILPNQITKVTSNTDARIFGPFTKIPGSLEADKNGKLPQIFKFYTNSEMRDLIVRLKKNTI